MCLWQETRGRWVGSGGRVVKGKGVDWCGNVSRPQSKWVTQTLLQFAYA